MKPTFMHLAVIAAFAASACAARNAGAADNLVPDSVVLQFEIARFDVSGNTLLSTADIDKTVQPFLGKVRDFGDVQRALEALEAVYHARGYKMVQIELPEQELNKGVVHLKVVEIKIGKIKIEGNKYFSDANIARSLPALREGQVPNLDMISTGIRLANENPAKKIALQMQSGERDDEVDAKLKVTEESPWALSANLDNTGTDSTGKSHVGVSMQHANFGGVDHVLSLQYTTTIEKPSQVSVYGFGYHVPLYSLGDSIDVFGSYSDVDSGSVTAGIFNLQVSGKGAVFGARYNHNLRRRGDYDAKITYGADYKAFRNTVDLGGFNLGNDVTVHPLSAAYSGTWTLPNGDANVSLTAVQNIAGGSNGRASDFSKARSDAPANFRALRYAAAFNRSLAGDWQLRTIINGQYSRDSLIPGEQFGAGGGGSVRGFAEREVSNDTGVQANVELYTPNFCPAAGTLAVQCRLVGFIDAAHAGRNHVLPGEQDSVNIAGAGFGVRLMLGKYANLQIDAGHVVNAGGMQGHDKNRVHVRLGLAY